MLKTKYLKDLHHNYLIADCPDAAAGELYPLRMVTDNHIAGLLPVSKRHINGEAFLYYSVNSLQVLRTMFEQRKMERAMAIRLLGGLRRVLLELKNYLLSDAGLVLAPEHIYLDWEREETYFLYYPFESEIAPNQARVFFEYLVRIIDHRDPALTDIVYNLCQLAEREAFTDEALERGLAQLAAEEEGGLNPVSAGIACAAPSFDATRGCPPTAAGNEACFAPDLPSADPPAAPLRKFLILALTSAAGAVFTFLYQQLLPLSPSETLLSWILLVVFLIFFLLMGGACLVLKRGLLNAKPAESELAHPAIDSLAPSNQAWPDADDSYGATIFLAGHEEARENKLYGSGRASKHVIELDRFPFTIGKLAASADYCLTETSVSRLHARFTQNENMVFLTDLNSTNGTFRNGIRLEPSETVCLEAGDEIRLGKVEFCYR